jgi:hypothetical protein
LVGISLWIRLVANAGFFRAQLNYLPAFGGFLANSGGSLIDPEGLVKELTKELVERMLVGEMTTEVPSDRNSTSSRN